MTRDEFDKLTEAEVRALFMQQAERLLDNARTTKAIGDWGERKFGLAPLNDPLLEILAATPDAATLLDMMDEAAATAEDDE